MKRNVSWKWVLRGLVGLLVVTMTLGSMIGGGSGGGGLGHVALVSLQGPITDSASGSLLGGSTGGTKAFIRDLESAVRNPLAKAIVIRINSPGGSASASQEMYQAVVRARKQKKVYASMGEVAASGGYYVAAACDKIYANPATLTGSIGVISQFLAYPDLLRKLGVGSETIKSGAFKDAGNPTRRLRPEERTLFQAMNRDIYDQFVDDIVAGRKSPTTGKLSREKLLPLADGRVFTGRQAEKVDLVDALGGLHEAVQDAGKAAGIAGEVRAEEIERPGLFGSLLGAEASAAASGVASQAGAAFGRSLAASVAEESKARLQQAAGAPKVEAGQ